MVTSYKLQVTSVKEAIMLTIT